LAVRQPPLKRWLLFVLLIAVITIAGLMALQRRPLASPTPTPAPISIQSTPWQIGADVTLTLSTVPPRADQPISLTLLAPGDHQPQVAVPSPEFFGLAGVQLLWLSPAAQETELALAAAGGARYLHLAFEWNRIEAQPGEYNWDQVDTALTLAKQYDLRLVPMLLYTPDWASQSAFAPLDYYRAPPTNYDDYRNFVYAVVNRYKPHGLSPLTADGYGITDWVIWNEPNVRPGPAAPEPGEFWIGSLEAYVRLLRAGYEGAHAADPGCNVLNGGLADVFWAPGKVDLITALERLYDPNGDGDAADGGRPFFDTLNVHTYQLKAPQAGWYQARLEALLPVMERFGDKQKPVWITETGYGTVTAPTQDSPYVDETTQAEAVRLVYETVSAYPQVKRVFWWSLRDYFSNAAETNAAMEAHYGLLQANFSPKPSYAAYGRLTGSLGEKLTTTVTTNAAGLSTVNIPATFIARAGTYVTFAEMDEATLTAVDLYPVREQH